jgi:putative ABC transport system permease protein
MSLRETLVSALHSLRSNRLRSLLTTLGIIIGVAAVITLVALGNGMQAGFDAQFSKLANQITVTSAPNAVPSGAVARPLIDQDVTALQNHNNLPHVAIAIPIMTGNGTLAQAQSTDNASLLGVTPDYLATADRSIEAGAWFTDADANAKKVVLGPDTLPLLYGPNIRPRRVIGTTVRINHTPFTVSGVLATDGQNDNVAIVPFNTARAYLVGKQAGTVSQVLIKATTADDVDAATTEIDTTLDKQHHIKAPNDRDYNVRAYANLLTQRAQFINFLTLFTAAIAAISLIVGGIGVANIMLVSVTERTREIGIRKAIGARRSAIMKQFLIESTVLAGLGGLIGVVIGVGVVIAGSIIMPKFAPDFGAPQVSGVAIAIALVVSMVIGLVAGGYPAWRAARLRPIEALRYQ